MNEEEMWQKFCSEFRAKISSITSHVAEKGRYASYDELVDTVTNIILLEINLGRKPWDEIPKKDIKLPSSEEFLRHAMARTPVNNLVKELSVRLEGELDSVYMSEGIEHPKMAALFALISALRNFTALCDRDNS